MVVSSSIWSRKSWKKFIGHQLFGPATQPDIGLLITWSYPLWAVSMNWTYYPHFMWSIFWALKEEGCKAKPNADTSVDEWLVDGQLLPVTTKLRERGREMGWNRGQLLNLLALQLPPEGNNTASGHKKRSPPALVSVALAQSLWRVMLSYSVYKTFESFLAHTFIQQDLELRVPSGDV